MAVIYRDNPFQTLNLIVDIENLVTSLESKEMEYERILQITSEIVKSWSNIAREQVTIKSLLGGITNQLLLIERNDSKSSKDKVIVRLFGGTTTDFINRTFENIVFAKLSSTGFGPIFYGVFGNGRIEGYLPGRSLSPDEMPTEPINRNIAKAVATLHSFHYPDIQYLSSLKFDELRDVDFQRLATDNEIPSFDHLQWVWNKAELFFSLSKDLQFPTPKQQQQYAALRLSEMHDELRWFCRTTEELHDKLKQWKDKKNCDIGGDLTRDRLLGRLYGLDEVFCHNDLLSGNVMLVKRSEESSEEEIKLIDYEYAGYNYRAYDIANHFCECCGFEFDVRKNFPMAEKRLDFLSNYLEANIPSISYENREEFLQGFEDMVCYFTLLSNLFWGTWSIVQAKGSTIDFDYLEYAGIRYDGYFYQKELYYREQFYLQF